MNSILETTNIIEQDGWMPIINGKIHLKQNQLLFIHQLSQAIRKEKGERMGAKNSILILCSNLIINA